jgi:hypothetical protein
LAHVFVGVQGQGVQWRMLLHPSEMSPQSLPHVRGTHGAVPHL